MSNTSIYIVISKSRALIKMWLTFQWVAFWISPLNKDIWMKSSITWVGFLQPDKCIRAKTEVPPVLFIYLFLIKTFHSGSGSNHNLKVPEGSWNLEDAKVPIICQHSHSCWKENAFWMAQLPAGWDSGVDPGNAAFGSHHPCCCGLFQLPLSHLYFGN